MNHEYKLKKLPAPPEYRNSAGRLLRLLQMLQSNSSYGESIPTLYDVEIQRLAADTKGQLYLDFMQIVSSAYEEFRDSVDSAETIPDPTRRVLNEGLSNLIQIVYPANLGNSPRPLQDAEVALLKMASSMLPEEQELLDDDKNKILESIERLKQTIDESDLPKSVRIALLEIVRLSRNALDQFNIHGARGFKAAFKRMLSELLEVYLDQGPDTVKNKSWWNQAFEHVKLIDAVAGRLLKYKPLLESVGRLFLGYGG